MMWLGSHNETAGATPLHSTKYILDESVLHLGVAMHVGYAEAFIAEGFPDGVRDGAGAAEEKYERRSSLRVFRQSSHTSLS